VAQGISNQLCLFFFAPVSKAITIHKMTAKILRAGYTKLGHHSFSSEPPTVGSTSADCGSIVWRPH